MITPKSPHANEVIRRSFDSDQDVQALAKAELNISYFCLAQANLMKHVMTADSLKCDGCGHTIMRELSNIDGVEKLVVDPENKLISTAKSFASCAVGRLGK